MPKAQCSGLFETLNTKLGEASLQFGCQELLSHERVTVVSRMYPLKPHSRPLHYLVLGR